MKKEIHPTYYPNATIACACGSVFSTGSTLESINVEICSNCHPFFTGKQKLIDSAGRVDSFKKRAALKASTASVRKGKKAKTAARASKRAAKEPASDA